MGTNVLFLLYTILYLCEVIVPNYNAVFLAAVTFVNIFAMVSNKKNRIWILFSITIMGSEAFSMANALIYIAIEWLTEPVKVHRKVRKITVILLAWFTGVALISGLLYSTTINSIVYFIYLALLYLMYNAIDIDVDSSTLKHIVRSFFLLEFASSIAIIVKCHSIVPGDIHGGTILNAHFFSNWLIMGIFAYAYLIKEKNKISISDIAVFSMAIFMLVMASANAVVISAICAILIYILYKFARHHAKNDLFWMIVLTYAAFSLFLGILYTPQIEQLISTKSNYLKLYLYSDGWNYKFKYFYGTIFDSLKGFRLFTGYGLGQYGSRIANAFAYDYMWRASNGFNSLISHVFSSHCVPEYAKYISFYTKDFVDGILWRSAVMSYPFSSFVALLGEAGLIGVFLVAYWVNKSFRKMKCKIILYYFLVVCIFDIFFDDFQCIFPLIVYINIFNRNYLDKQSKKVYLS